MTGDSPSMAPTRPEREFRDRLERVMAGRVHHLHHLAPRRLQGRADATDVVEVLQGLRDELGCLHLSAISGLDLPEGFEVVYHVSAPAGILLSLHVALPREAPTIATATGIYPAAVLYERETHDLFGITFEGHPDPRRLLLYEGWPEGEFPLRKDWKPDGEGGS